MDEGVFVGWLKKDGESVKMGEPLFTLEGDKAAQEVEATESGVLRIPADAPKAGATVSVGAVLGYLIGRGEEAADTDVMALHSVVHLHSLGLAKTDNVHVRDAGIAALRLARGPAHQLHAAITNRRCQRGHFF